MIPGMSLLCLYVVDLLVEIELFASSLSLFIFNSVQSVIFGKPVGIEMHEFDPALSSQRSSQEQLHSIGLSQVICQF